MQMLNESLDPKRALAATTAPWECLKSQMYVWERGEDDRSQIQKTELSIYPVGSNRLSNTNDKTSIKIYFNLTWKEQLLRATSTLGSPAAPASPEVTKPTVSDFQQHELSLTSNQKQPLLISSTHAQKDIFSYWKHDIFRECINSLLIPQIPLFS